MNFESLVSHIDTVQHALQAQAAHAVNLSLTARNWLIGYYIVERNYILFAPNIRFSFEISKPTLKDTLKFIVSPIYFFYGVF